MCEAGGELWAGAVVACFLSKTFTASSLERWWRVCRIPIKAISTTPAATAAQRKADRRRGVERNQFAPNQFTLVPANGSDPTCGGRASETTALQSPQRARCWRMWSRSGTASDRSAKAVSRSASGCGSAAVGDCNRFTTILGTLCICRLQLQNCVKDTQRLNPAFRLTGNGAA